MKDKPSEKTIPISQLLLDVHNPRLPEIQDSQHNTIRTMAKTQAEKIIALAQHLMDNGPNPASLPIVMPSSRDEGMYYVLDGNRRVAALRLLESPTLAEGIFDGIKLQKLKRISAKFEKSPITNLRCVVVASQDEADVWIQLIHRGQQQGAGLVEWDGQVAARYDARKSNKPNTALEVLDYVKEHAPLSGKTLQRINSGKFPITSLERLIKTPYVRKKLGIDKAKDGKVLIAFPEEEVLKGLARVVDDLGSGEVTVSKIKSQVQRIDYINKLSKEELPDPEKALARRRVLDVPPSVKAKSGVRSTTDQKPRSPIRYRAALIPKDCKLRISHHRIYRIFAELKRLNIDDFPNAGAVMLRVFVELSLDHFLDDTIGWSEQQLINSKLAHKLTTVANYLENNSVMTVSQLAPIRKAAGGHTLLAASIKTMHGYVHNRHFSPVASELKTAWDDIQPFMEKLWSV